TLFVAIFFRVSVWENDEALFEFRILCQQLLDRIHAQLSAQEVFLEQLNRTFVGPAQLSRDDFHRLAEGLLGQFPTIQAVEWAPVVEGADRAQFEGAQRRQMPRFEIRERNAAGGLQRAAERPRYYPVTYLEPVDSNAVAIGFDLGSEPKRRSAVERA